MSQLRTKSNITNALRVVTDGRSDYLNILEEAWQQHLAPRESGAPTVISLFAGCGGSSLGYSMAGFRELLAVEWDNNAVETFKLNFSDVPVYHGDIANLSIDEASQMTGLKEGELDILDGSPPCQGFSTAGKRNLHDSRNQLFQEYVRLLRGLRPKVFVMENVSGMVKGKMKLIFAEIMRELKASGYRVSARLMNAMYFNVPQSRERMIFVGVREDLEIEPSHPKANTCPFSASSAIEASAIRRGFGGIRKKQFNNRYRSLDLPSPTLEKTRPPILHFGNYEEARELTLSESARLGCFPDEFQFTGKNAYQHIGNSVPPLFMRVIATHIREQILSKIQ